MTTTVEQLKPTLAALPKNDRAALAHFLIGSLDEDDTNIDENAAFAAEINRRIAEMEQDENASVDYEEAMAELRAEFPK